MKNTVVLFLSTLLVMLLWNCNNQTTNEVKRSFISTDSIIGVKVADTIIYDVIIKNNNPEDSWSSECLKYLKHDALIDSIFDAVYSGKFKAYDHFTGSLLSIKSIKEMETQDGFSRNAIGKIQFSEIWYFSSEYTVLNKKVISMVLGLEQYNNLGELKGYKPVFKVYLN
ncbi:MAG: hypothetical protein JXA77_18835 [Bacteroidales bacterium]|nr:hypothetical protein [Bacteroidales bacterium]MBN2821490.1 hypothetical protein [Bacteroidales bacterium]